MYKSTLTNSGNPTYYFRGNIENNYVDFAGFIWRIIRINEDETIRLIMQDGINNNSSYPFNSTRNMQITNMYYSKSDAKTAINSWYTTNITNKGYGSKIATGNYFCEQAKVSHDSVLITNSKANMILYTKYTPNFECAPDNNTYGLINTNVGLISYDAVVHAGGYYGVRDSTYYLYNGKNYWTISTAGIESGYGSAIWGMLSSKLTPDAVNSTNGYRLRPVINLKADVEWASGNGASGTPYKIK